MKKQFLFATLALATMFTACSKEEELSKNAGTTPVNFVIGGVGSRTTTSDSYVATFDEGNKVGIISADTDPTIENAEFTVSGSALTNNSTYKLVKDKAATFYAYYPHVESATSDNVVYTVASDQSDADKFNANDFMTATASLDANVDNGTVSFNFDHQMAFVEVIFGSNLEDAGVTSVSMGIANNQIKYNFVPAPASEGEEAEKNLTVQGASATITMFNATAQDATKKKFWAIIPPQTTTANETLFTITVASGQTYSYKPANGETFAGNAIRRIKLEIMNDIPEVEPVVFSVSSVSINGWENADSVEDPDDVFNVTEEKLEVIATLPTSFKTVTNRNQLSDTEQWGVNGALATITDDIIKIKGMTDATGKSWYNNTLYYNFGSTNQLIPGIDYKVTVEFKPEAIVTGEGEEATSTTPQLRIVACTKDKHILTEGGNETDVFYMTNQTTAPINVTSSSASTADFTEYTFNINAKYLASGYNSTSSVENADKMDVVIALSAFNVNSAAFYIKSIKIEQQ